MNHSRKVSYSLGNTNGSVTGNQKVHYYWTFLFRDF